MLAREPGDSIAILVLASFLRDDMPWLYELGMEAYHIAKRGSHEQTNRAKRNCSYAFALLDCERVRRRLEFNERPLATSLTALRSPAFARGPLAGTARPVCY
jgi:hypothetical protein